ncbi:MAG: DUF2959 family protein [Planctomycetota bacterium]
MARLLTAAVLMLCFAVLLPGCGATRHAGYKFWESFGYEKRDLFVDQVQDARAEQEDTREEFASALDQFKATFGFEGGDLEAAYDSLKGSYDDVASQADSLRGEVDKVKTIAGDLFEEWAEEIATQNNPDYRRAMQQQYDATEASYNDMIAAMDRAVGKMDPVLQDFNDRVLFLKSSLNAKAIAALQTNADELIGDIDALIAEMNASIAEADAFLAELEG